LRDRRNPTLCPGNPKESYIFEGIYIKMRRLPVGILFAILLAQGVAKEGETTQSAVDMMVLMKDFSAMDESFYLAFDPKETVEGNANQSFKHFMQKALLDGEMTEEELELFRERFVEEVKKEAHRDHLTKLAPTEEDKTWKAEIKKALEDQKPAVTAKLVEIINEEANKEKTAHPDQEPWHAEMHEWLKKISLLDMTMLSGFTPDPESEKKLDDANDLVAEKESTSLLEVPSTFDGREKWPKCKEVMSIIRDQGLCGSCWAQAAAGAMDGRLCVATGGKFSGPNAKISAGYIASCFNNGRDGCRGGHPGSALRYATRGVPTEQCSPYFASGDALNHFKDQGSRSPACPTKCKGGSSLDQASFVGSGGATMQLQQMKASMVQGGSIAIGFKVFKDFMGYKNGIYTPRTSQSSGMHATTALGYGSNYILSANSWGARWGDRGFFKMTSTCCQLAYFVPDQYSSSQKGLPLQGGGAGGGSVPSPSPPSPSPPSGGGGGGGSGPLLGAKFISAATEAQVRQCTGGALLLDVEDVLEYKELPINNTGMLEESVYERRLASARRRRRRSGKKSKKSKSSRRRRRRRRRRSAKPTPKPAPKPAPKPQPKPAPKPAPQPAAKGSRCVLYFGSAH
jgi:C1A family cysteine protease